MTTYNEFILYIHFRTEVISELLILRLGVYPIRTIDVFPGILGPQGIGITKGARRVSYLCVGA